MSWLDRFRRRHGEQSAAFGRLAYPDRAARTNWTLSNSEVIYAAVSRISNTFGMIPVGLYKGYEPIKGAIADLLVHPNDNMTQMEFFRTLEVDRLTAGNGYAMLVRSVAGDVLLMDVVDPSRVTPQINTDNGDLWYRVDLAQYGQVLLHNTDMIHVRTLSADGIRGIPPTQVLARTIDYSESIAKFSLTALENGVHSGLVVDFPAELSKKKREEAVTQLMDIYKKSGGALIALDAGVRATRMDGSMIDPKLMDVDRITRLRVAAVYNMPPHMLGDYSSNSYSSLEQEMLEFSTMTMAPNVATYQQEFNRKLLTRAMMADGISTRWDMSVLAQVDSNALAEMYFKEVRSMGTTPNEWRARRGKPPMPGGDELYASRDMIALKDLDKLPGGAQGGERR